MKLVSQRSRGNIAQTGDFVKSELKSTVHEFRRPSPDGLISWNYKKEKDLLCVQKYAFYTHTHTHIKTHHVFARRVITENFLKKDTTSLVATFSRALFGTSDPR